MPDDETTRKIDATFAAGQLDGVQHDLKALHERVIRIHSQHLNRLGTTAACDERYSDVVRALERAESYIVRIVQSDCAPATKIAPAPPEPPPNRPY